MRDDVAKDLTRSAAAFIDVVWPVIGLEWFGGGEIVPVEAVTQEVFAGFLDRDAGVDAWLIRKSQGITPLASRIQFMRNGYPPYNTITIRSWRASGAPTELHKRMLAISKPNRGYLYPHVTIQAYLRGDDRTFLSAAAVLTRDLFKHVDCYPDQTNRDQRSGFKIARWNHLRTLGAHIQIKEVA